MTFLHGADFHLDSPFGALPARQAAERRRESRELPRHLADYVNGHGVDLVLLAGDLFDSANVFRETGEQLAEELWAALDSENKVALFVRYTCLADGTRRDIIQNRF